MKKILMLNYEYPPLGGGASPFTKDLAEEISQMHRVDIVTMWYKGLPKKEVQGNLQVYRVKCLRGKKESCSTHEMFSYLVSAYNKCNRLCKKNKYDLIHAHFIIPTGMLAQVLSKKFKIPYIISSHGSDVPGYNPDRFKLEHKIILPLWKRVVRKSKFIITPSKRHKDIILRKINTDVKVIPYGIYIENPVHMKKQKIVLYAGRLFERKGVQYLIRAMDGIKGWKLVIAGDGYYKNELLRISKTVNAHIEFTGWLSKKELYQFYKKSSVFVLPSLEESFGMVIAESMMFRNAVITTKGTACEEVVGDAGLLVKMKSVEDLRQKILSFVDDKNKLRKYQKMAKKKVKEYSWEKTRERYLGIYEKTWN